MIYLLVSVSHIDAIMLSSCHRRAVACQHCNSASTTHGCHWAPRSAINHHHAVCSTINRGALVMRWPCGRATPAHSQHHKNFSKNTESAGGCSPGKIALVYTRTPTAVMTRLVSALLVHLPWPIVVFECTRTPFSMTSKFPVAPGSRSDVTATELPNS